MEQNYVAELVECFVHYGYSLDMINGFLWAEKGALRQLSKVYFQNNMYTLRKRLRKIG